MSVEHSVLEGGVLEVSKGCDQLLTCPVPQLPRAQ